MLNRTKGENHTLDKMKKENYQIYKASSADSKVEAKENKAVHQEFILKGKLDENDLENLAKEGWKKLYPILPQHKTIPESTWVYQGKTSLAIIYANSETNMHSVHLQTNPEEVDGIKKAFEDSLKCKLYTEVPNAELN